MLDHIRQNRENMLNTFSNKDELIKGGPGSGRVIGRTKSGKDVAEYGDVRKGEKVSMDKDELIDEHKKLVATLESDSHEDDKREARDQKEELDDLKKGGGEGSKGGKVVGHTRSGGAIYEHTKITGESGGMKHSDFSEAAHHHATMSAYHQQMSQDHNLPPVEKRAHKIEAEKHSKALYDTHHKDKGRTDKQGEGATTHYEAAALKGYNKRRVDGEVKEYGDKHSEVNKESVAALGQKKKTTTDNLKTVKDVAAKHGFHYIAHDHSKDLGSSNVGLQPDHDKQEGANERWKNLHAELKSHPAFKNVKSSAYYTSSGGKMASMEVEHNHDSVKKSEDLHTLTPLEHQELIKSQIANSLYGSALTEEELEKSANDYFEKGKKAATIGEQRTFGGKEYIKVASGWRLVGKNKGKHKDVSEMLHGKKDAGDAAAYGADVTAMSDADVEAKYNQYKKVSSNPNFNEHGKKLLAKYEAEMNKRKGSKKDAGDAAAKHNHDKERFNEDIDPEHKHKIGDPVKVAQGITDPIGKQGHTGTAVKVTDDEVSVRFDDGNLGRYQHNTLHKKTKSEKDLK